MLRSAHTDPDGHRNSDDDFHALAFTDLEPDPFTFPHTQQHCHPASEPEPHTNPNGHLYFHRLGNAYFYLLSNTPAHRHRNADRFDHAHPRSDPLAQLEPQPVTHTDASPNHYPERDTHASFHSHSECVADAIL